jgi:positive regulator of sigma E activity
MGTPKDREVDRIMASTILLYLIPLVVLIVISVLVGQVAIAIRRMDVPSLRNQDG